jgi:uncharacterized protein (TIGR02145 family)
MKKLLFLILLIFFLSCEKDNDDIKFKKSKLTGVVQKGPFISGTQIIMGELNSSLEQTGKIFTSQIIDELGFFEITNIELSSNYVDLSANGYYFNEISGKLSSSQLSLYALSNISDKSTVNINIMTHLEKRRVEYLLKEDELNFENAKHKAQKEILSIFGMESDKMGNSETLDINQDDESNAIMLAISIILQGSRNIGELTELLASISNDIHDDGVLNDNNLLDKLRKSALELNLGNIRSNLESRYKNFGLTANIPDFENYINIFLAHSSEKPYISISKATNITNTSVTLSGIVNPNSAITEVFFEYGKTTDFGNIIDADQSPINGHTETNVSVTITDLEPGITYYFRIKAENERGVTYGDDHIFTTTITGIEGTVMDEDGNIYQTIGIGQQLWMAENLKTTKYNDGTDIPLVTDSIAWGNLNTPGYCWYANDSNTYAQTYGALYNWYTVETGNLCPTRWHVPTDSEWTELTNYLGGESVAGGKLKETGITHWNSPNTRATNETSFTALAGGQRGSCGSFAFVANSNQWPSLCRGFWWSATKYNTDNAAWFRSMDYNYCNVYRYLDNKKTGFSVRCLRD